MTVLGDNLVALVSIVGLIVLTAMHDVSATASVPAIVTLAGVHVGAKVRKQAP